MAVGLRIEPHLTDEALTEAFRSEKRPRVRRRIHLIWLMQTKGLSTKVAGQLIDMTQPTACRWARRYNSGGLESLVGKQEGQTPNRIISPEMQVVLYELFAKPPPESVNGGLWDGPKVVAIVESNWGVQITRQTGWLHLRKAGYSPQTMRPRHRRTTDVQRDEFKKNATSRNKKHKSKDR